MGLAKCYALVHAISAQNGVETVWADEDQAGQAACMDQAREIIRNNYIFRDK